MKTLILLAALAAIAAPAAAGDLDVRQTTLKYADLDLRKPAGAEAMLTRIRRAAVTVCGPAPIPRELDERARFRACVVRAIDDTVKQLDAPLVTARHEARATMLVAR